MSDDDGKLLTQTELERARPICEWDGTELFDMTAHLKLGGGMVKAFGHCSKCGRTAWSRPVRVQFEPTCEIAQVDNKST